MKMIVVFVFLVPFALQASSNEEELRRIFENEVGSAGNLTPRPLSPSMEQMEQSRIQVKREAKSNKLSNKSAVSLLKPVLTKNMTK